MEKKSTLKSRTTFLRKICECAGVECFDAPQGDPEDCLVMIEDPDNYGEITRLNIILSFCALHKYPVVRAPESPFEEFLDYHFRKS
jgi:hypothetical protein